MHQKIALFIELSTRFLPLLKSNSTLVDFSAKIHKIIELIENFSLKLFREIGLKLFRDFINPYLQILPKFSTSNDDDQFVYYLHIKPLKNGKFF